MHWQSKTAASLLAAGMIATLSASAGAASNKADSGAAPNTATTTTTTTTVVPGDTPPIIAAPVVETKTTETVVVVPSGSADWSVNGGRVVKGSHMGTAELVGFYDGLVDGQATYRYGLADRLGLGLMFAWNQPFIANVSQASASYYNALILSPFVTLGLLERPRWDIGLTLAPGLRWAFGGCYQGSTGCFRESKAVTLTIRAAVLYTVVPRILKFGGAIDVYSDMTIKNNGVAFSLPLLVGGVFEYQVSENFALTAEAKGGLWAGSYYSISQKQVYYITRFALGLAFHGVP